MHLKRRKIWQHEVQRRITMDYKEFKKYLLQVVEEKMEGTNVIATTVNKNNNLMKEGLTYRDDTVGGAPIIYFEDMYEWYGEEGDIESIRDFIVDIFDKRIDISTDDVLGEWEQVKDRLSIKVVNYERNKEVLGEYIYKRVLNLAGVVQLRVCDIAGSVAYTKVRREFLTKWNVTEDELWKTAFDNLKKETFEIKTLKQKVLEMLGINDEDNDVTEDNCFVLCSQNESFGAKAILREDLMRSFAEKHASDFYVLPSSVYEVLLVLDNGILNADDLKQMVQQVNQEVVSEEDWLSDEIYLYNFKDNELQIA